MMVVLGIVVRVVVRLVIMLGGKLGGRLGMVDLVVVVGIVGVCWVVGLVVVGLVLLVLVGVVVVGVGVELLWVVRLVRLVLVKFVVVRLVQELFEFFVIYIGVVLGNIVVIWCIVGGRFQLCVMESLLMLVEQLVSVVIGGCGGLVICFLILGRFLLFVVLVGVWLDLVG